MPYSHETYVCMYTYAIIIQCYSSGKVLPTISRTQEMHASQTEKANLAPAVVM